MDSPQPPDFSRLLADIGRALRDSQIPFMLIGGQAVLLHGRPRLTEAIDGGMKTFENWLHQNSSKTSLKPAT